MRVFTAVQLPAEISKLAEKGLREFDPFGTSIRWVNFKAIHATLHFFANLTSERVKELGEITEGILQKLNPFSLSLSEPGFFPSESHPRVFWWGVCPSGPLEELHRTLSEAYRQRDFALEERSFTAHFTLGRFRSLDFRIESLDDFNRKLKNSWLLSGQNFQVDRVKLFKSPQGPEGYPVLDEFQFKE
jgi:2'-5' RNA ligase